MPRVILLTGCETRHSFFRKFLSISPDIQMIKTFCESPISIEKLISVGESTDLRTMHLEARTQSEKDFFGAFVDSCPDHSNPVEIIRGSINQEDHVRSIIDLNPDFLVSYGCSIIKSDLLKHFKGRFINLHLGLSPYYRGSGTNFWPLVNQEPQLVGATFMHIDEGIDTGEIIHQIRAKVVPFDTVHSIGNRLIKDACLVLRRILTKGLKKNVTIHPNLDHVVEKVYKNKDYSEYSVRKLYSNFNNGMIEKYLINQREIDLNYPLVQNPAFDQD